MKLQDAKEQVAEKLGYQSWSRIHPHYHEHYFDEVAELYARAKWHEACPVLHRKLRREFTTQTRI